MSAAWRRTSKVPNSIEVKKLSVRFAAQFPALHGHLKAAMSAEMEKVVREEKFLHEEPAHLDGALRRCKKLTNTMITMKKLALVQDDGRNNAEVRHLSKQLCKGDFI